MRAIPSIAIAAVLIAYPLYAGPAAAAAKFLSPAQFDPAKLLPPPPAENSDPAKAELAELQTIEKTRSPARLERAKLDDKTEDASIFNDAIGAGFDLKKLPATAKLMADVRADEQAAAGAAKTFFKRHRPWIVDTAMQSCSREDAPDSSYPSGHSTMGYSMGFVLASLIPDKAQAILHRADQYAESRLICGMHFRRDIEAGHVLGTAVAIELMEDKAFKADYDAAATELRAAHLVGN